MGLAEQFTNLGEDLIGSFDARVNFLGENTVDIHKTLEGFRKDHRAMGKKLRADLGAFVDDLTDETHDFLDQCRTDNRKAHQAWEKVAKTMAAKRRNFKGTLTAAKRKATLAP